MHRKTVLITGASKGIGKAIATIFAKNGYNTIINGYNNPNALMLFSEALKSKGYHVLPILADISDPEQVAQLIEEATLYFGPIQTLIHNAGISHYELITETSNASWEKVIQTNLSSAFYLSKGVLPTMIQEKQGTIIHISSIFGTHGAAMEVAYSTSKAGLNGFTKALAKEVGPSGIRVNAIALGAIETDMNNRMTSKEKADFKENIALCRFGSVDEVADLVYFLATSAPYMTGEILHYDGGY